MANITIEDLPSTSVPTEQHRVPAMKDGLTVFLTIGQILSFVQSKVGGYLPGYIHDAVAKTLLVGADEFGLWDSISGNSAKITVQDFIWQCRCGIGQRYYVDTSKTGAEIPPSGMTGPVFIELAAGLTGAGAFNNGKLTSESVSGSAPTVLASAAISFATSPMVGQVVDLVMTEGRIERPSTTPGAKQGDALQNIIGTFTTRRSDGGAEDPYEYTGAFAAGGTSGLGNVKTLGSALPGRINTFDASRVVRTDTETRMKNGGVKAYMRIK